MENPIFHRKNLEFFIILFIFSVTIKVYSQNYIEITGLKQNDQAIIITYDLVHKAKDDLFVVDAKYRTNDETSFQQIDNAIGFIGNNISPGINKSIIWYVFKDMNVNKELPIEFELSAIKQPAIEYIPAYSTLLLSDEYIISKSFTIYFEENKYNLNWNLKLNSENNEFNKIDLQLKELIHSYQNGEQGFSISIDAYGDLGTEETFNQGIGENRVKSSETYIVDRLKAIAKRDSIDQKIVSDIIAHLPFNLVYHGTDWNGFMKILSESSIKDKDTFLNYLKILNSPAEKEQFIRSCIVLYPELDTLCFKLCRAEVVFQKLVENRLKKSINPDNSYEINNAINLTKDRYLTFDPLDLFDLTSYINDDYSKIKIFEIINNDLDSNWSYLNEYGISLIKKGSYQKGMNLLLKANSINPNSYVILNNIGYAYTFLRDSSLAIVKFNEAQINCRNPVDSLIITKNLNTFKISSINNSSAINDDTIFTIEPLKLESNNPFENPKSNKYAIIIGISDYYHLVPPPDHPKYDRNYDLKYADTDANNFCNLIKDSSYFDRGWKITKLINEQATINVLYDTIQNIFREASENDVIFLYFSGHGTNDKEKSYLLAYDSDTYPPISPNKAISLDIWLKDEVTYSKSKYIYLFIDACSSGSIDLKGPNQKDFFLSQLLKENTCKIAFTSGTNFEASAESDSLKSGIFSYYLIKGLKGDAPDMDGNSFVDFNELMDYVNSETKSFQKMVNNIEIQNPSYSKSFGTSSHVPVSKRK